MTKHEKAFNDFVDMCIKLLETEAIEKGIDCEEAKRFVINLNGNLKGSDISEKNA